MASRGRGGKRTPANPAPVSGPGALSRRTDGGPSQPVRPIPGGGYGDRQASVQQQQAAPLASAPEVAAGSPGAAGGPVATSTMPADIAGSVFASTNRPGEPITAGASPLGGAQQGTENALTLLQVLFEQDPNEDLARLIMDLQSRGRPGGRA